MTNAALDRSANSYSSRFNWAGYALGFGLGGFFDGILLHQILQWHHLLSGVEQARQDIRVLIMTDGLFHALMYVITGLGLLLLWRSRQEFPEPGADRRLFANALIGFGIWHILDSILSHWVLGIHRIRMDVDNPLFWDLLWFAVFGLVPVVGGWLMRRRKRGGDAHRVMSAPVALVLAVAVAGPLAALPAPSDGTVMVLFRPGITSQQAFVAMQAVEGRVLWTDPSGQLWAINMPEDGESSQLYGFGAMLVSNSILPAGCFNWIKV